MEPPAAPPPAPPIAPPPPPPPGAAAPPPGPRPPIYPMVTTLDKTVTMSRLWGIPLLGVMVRWFLLIPHYIVLAFYGILFGLLQLVVWILSSSTGATRRGAIRSSAASSAGSPASRPTRPSPRRRTRPSRRARATTWTSARTSHSRWPGGPAQPYLRRLDPGIPADPPPDHPVLPGDRGRVPGPRDLVPGAHERALRRLGVPDRRRLHALAEPHRSATPSS